MKKIMITGFPHSGTTILRKIVGQCSNCVEVSDREYKEVPEPYLNSKEDFVVTKWPYFIKDFETEKYKDYVFIYIIRDPRYSLSSIKRRGYKSFSRNLSDWKFVSDKYIHNSKLKKKNWYFLKYEDMFDENFKRIKEIFKEVGLKFSSDTFSTKGSLSKSNAPKETDHLNFRYWQMDHDFKSMNTPEKITLSSSEISKVINTKQYKYLYGK